MDKHLLDQEQEKLAQLEEESKKLSDTDEYLKTIMSHHLGRKFIYEYLSDIGVWTDTFHTDPTSHARYAGLRGAGLMLISRIKRVAAKSYATMIEENI